MSHTLFMQEAIKLAETNVSTNKGGPFGAVIVKKNQIIARGANCVAATHDPTAHAEITAIRQACTFLNSFFLDGCYIYTSCEPCPMCLGAIYWARLERIYYASTRQDAALAGFSDQLIYEELSYSINQRSIMAEQLLHDEGTKLFKLWENSAQKILYDIRNS